jgi:hypothetical protein
MRPGRVPRSVYHVDCVYLLLLLPRWDVERSHVITSQDLLRPSISAGLCESPLGSMEMGAARVNKKPVWPVNTRSLDPLPSVSSKDARPVESTSLKVQMSLRKATSENVSNKQRIPRS